MIKVIKTTTPYIPKNGDILFGNEFIERFDATILKKSIVPLPVIFYGHNPWSTLKRLSIDCEEFKKQVTYGCPFLNNTYFWTLPLILVYTNVDDYPNIRKDSYAMDSEWYKHALDLAKESSTDFQLDQVEKSFMGHGYTEGTLPSDGSNDLVTTQVRLSNGDFLICKTWEWYNK